MSLLPIEQIQKRIYFIREHKVMLDSDQAELYQVPTNCDTDVAPARESGKLEEV
jgi:hypothetical protein